MIADRETKRAALGWGVAALLYVAGMGLTFRGALHGASLGDNSDGGIVLAILEHWVRVFSGRAADWRSPGWYWPAPHALGLSDSLFLLAVPYGLARAAGAGWFVANDVAIGTMAVAGFWGMVFLTRRLGTPLAIGGAVAFVFSFGVVPIFKLGHAQTYTMQLAPVLGLFLVGAWRGHPAWAAGAGGLAGLMFFTAAQTPWFLGLEGGLALAAGVLAARGRVDWWRGVRVGGWFAVGLAVGLVPFVLLYWQSFALRRDFSAAHFYSGWPRDLLNFPPGEMLWSWMGRLTGAERPEAEVSLGLTPLLALVAVVLLLRGNRAGRACLAAGLLGPLLAIDYWGIEPWKLIFYGVPGGNAVRTPFRIELAAQFFLCLGLGLALARTVAGSHIAVGVLLGILVVEQVGAAPSARESGEMERWLSAAHRPTFACGAFYLLPGGEGPWHRYQADAMLLSQQLGMPTVNGNSSFYPPGWEMSHPEAAAYPGQVLQWLDTYAIRDQVCGVDPRRGVWVAGVGPLLTARPTPATPVP